MHYYQSLTGQPAPSYIIAQRVRARRLPGFFDSRLAREPVYAAGIRTVQPSKIFLVEALGFTTISE